jgi:hypothetical protein
MAIDQPPRRAEGAATNEGAPATMSDVEPVVVEVRVTPVDLASVEHKRFVGVVTRATSWVLDAIAINLVAIITGLGAELIFSIFPVSPHFASVLKPIAGAIYIVWAGAYFVVFWSWTGQTLGARTMQIRLIARNGGRVKPARAVVRWVGMNLAMLQLSLAQARMAALRGAGNGRAGPPGTPHATD